MNLDFSSLAKAIASLRMALAARAADPANEFVRDSCIQRFEYTYELAHKMLKRYLEASEPDAAAIDTMGMADLVRTGWERGLLKSSWDKWVAYRAARNITSHTYNPDKANEVVAIIPAFLEEAAFLFERLTSK